MLGIEPRVLHNMPSKCSTTELQTRSFFFFPFEVISPSVVQAGMIGVYQCAASLSFLPELCTPKPHRHLVWTGHPSLKWGKDKSVSIKSSRGSQEEQGSRLGE